MLKPKDVYIIAKAALEAFRRTFFAAIDKKTSWGKNEILVVFLECIPTALAEVLPEDSDE